MQTLKRYYFAKKDMAPNTFIGGVAATINTPALVASKLGILESRIKGFRVVGSDIEFAVIGGSYVIPERAFGNTTVVSANQDITYYYDDAGLVTSLGTYCFRNCGSFIDFRFSANITYIGNSVFYNTGLVNADLSYLTAGVTGEWPNMLQYCTELVYADTGLLGTIGQTSVSFFRGCGKLETIITKAKYYDQPFRDAGAQVNYYNEYVLELRSFSFSHGCKFEKIELPNCTLLRNETFYNPSGTKYLKEVIIPKATSIGIDGGNGSCFRGQNLLELVDLRACKYFYRPSNSVFEMNFRDACKSGTVVKVHEFMATSSSGSPDEELVYIKNTRGGIVEFYDDSGNYVSTL